MSPRISKRKVVPGIAALLVVLVCGALFLSTGGYPREVTLTGGHKLRLERVSFGNLEPFKPGGTLQRLGQALASHLPKKWANKIVAPRTSNKASWFNNFFLSHTNEPALHIWLTRVDPRTGRFVNVGVQSAEIVDADGCAFGCTTAGGWDDGLLPSTATNIVSTATGTVRQVYTRNSPRESSVNCFRFEVFPRHEERFKLRLFDSTHELMAEYVIANPAPVAARQRWQTQSIPASVTNGDMVFTLTAANPAPGLPELITGAVSYLMPREVLYEFDYARGGTKLTNWDAVAMDLWDSSGNLAPKWGNHPFALCPSEPAWKLRVSFTGRDDASNQTWTVSHLPVPPPGLALPMSTNAVIDGITIRLLGMGGSGETVYSNGVPISARASTSPLIGALVSGASLARTFRADRPHVALILGSLNEDQRLSVYATDDQGRRSYLREGSGSSYGGPVMRFGEGLPRGSFQYIGPVTSIATMPGQGAIKYLLFDEAADSKIVDLTFCVHRTRTVDFIFKPPPGLVQSKSVISN